MNLTRMRLLLVAWWCATVLPGLTLAIFLTDDVLDGSGWVFGVWIAGYLVQLFLFMAVSQKIKGAGAMVLVWIVVSLLPWGVDWAIGLNWWAEIACVLAAVAIAFYVDLNLTRTTVLQRDGIRATATVLEVKKPLMNVVVNNVYIKRKLRIRVERDDGAPAYETTFADLFMLGSVPDPGDSFRVVVDPGRPQHVAAADSSDAGPSVDRAPAAAQALPSSGRRTSWRFTSWRGPGRSATAVRAPARPTSYEPYRAEPATTPTADRDLSSALARLAELHQGGQLTDAEFAQAKQELLGTEDSAPPG